MGEVLDIFTIFRTRRGELELFEIINGDELNSAEFVVIKIN